MIRAQTIEMTTLLLLVKSMLFLWRASDLPEPVLSHFTAWLLVGGEEGSVGGGEADLRDSHQLHHQGMEFKESWEDKEQRAPVVVRSSLRLSTSRPLLPAPVAIALASPRTVRPMHDAL